MKLIWCNGFPDIYAQLAGGGSICHRYMCIILYICNLCGALVFKRSMLDLRRGWGQSAIHKCALCYLYMQLMWCIGFQKIYAQLEEGVGSICNMQMCIVLCIYLKLIWCDGFPEIYAQLEEGGQSPMGICALCYIYLKLMWCNGFPICQ